MAMFLCLFLLCVTDVFSFNVDIESRVVHRGTPNSMFGFTVQAHVEGDQRMLLVGAPEADPRRQQDVEKPGAVFRCEPGASGRCREVIFDTKGNNVDQQKRQVDKKSNQWFGATLTSTGANGPIVACAPRYVSFVSPKQDQRNPVGSCYLARSTSSPTNEINEFSPCRTSTHGQRKTGVCQAGFAAAISKDGQRLFMGAPGSWYWQGQLYSQSLDQKPTLISTLEGNAKFDDSYMGYSVAVGDFAGQAMQGVAVGVPRGSDLKGLVVLYTWELQNIKNISGSQIGAYFGYCLASGDIDGDGFDDVIVGSPMFSSPKMDGYEHGRVYVIYQGKDRAFQRNHARTGEVSRGRFGLSVASLGDINLDGFGDFAVGAPYGGPNGRGVVFIYHGSELGVREKYSQAITSEEVSSPPFLNTFGFSLSGGVDLDNNNYTDLIVGAYKSDSVVFFRSRPVVKVMAEVRFMGESKLISLDDKKCTLRNGTSVVCAHLMFCLTYDGINVNRQIDFKVTLDLDSKQKTSKRLFLMESRQTTYSEHILLIQGKQGCREVNVYLDDDIRDKLTPIEVAMTYELMTQYAGDVIPPVLDQTTNNVFTDSLHIQKNCGRDNICVPDLKMSVTTPNINYVLGSTENVNIDVKVENAGEDAFEAAYYLHIPNGVTYSKMERLDKEEADEAPIYCSILSRDASGNSTLKCDLGNPMSRSLLVRFRVILEVDSRVTSLNFDMTSNSTNPEHGTDYDNSQHLAIGVVIRAHLEIIGTSDPPELHYNASLYQSEDLSDDTKLGPQVIHKYNIKNEGPFAVDEAEIIIMWPYQTLDGNNLMYMLVQPEWIGDMQCDAARHVNPLNLFVHNPYNSPLLNEKEAMLKSELYKGIKISRGGGYYGQTYLEEGAPHSASASHSYQGGSQVNHHAGGYDESETQGQTFTSQEEETIRRNVAAAASQSGVRQESHNQNTEQRINAQRNDYDQRQFEQRNREGYGQSNYDQRNYDQRNYDQRNYDQRNYDQRNYERGYGVDANAIGGSVGGAGQVIRRWNKTITYDAQGNVIEHAESSTEFGSLGHEGKAGSSFSNRYGADAANHHQHQQQSNQNNQEQWQYSSAGNNERKHTWSTEESINRDLYNAGSSTYRDDKITVVGDETDEIGGFGAYAAQSPNNEFKYGVADLGVSGGQSSRGYSSGHVSESGREYGQGYGREYEGGRAGYAAGSSRSSSSGGYAYSSSSSSRQAADAAYNAQYESSYNSQRRDNTRRRRQTADPEIQGLFNKCQEKYRCQVIRCTTGRMAKGQEVWLALRSRINASVLNEITQDRAVKLSTLASARVSKLPMVGRPSEPSWHTAEAQTVVTPQLEALSSGSVPLWVIILAAIVGALLLLLLIFLLYKCGFFKRNRPSDHAERQPLNGRDEHL